MPLTAHSQDIWTITPEGDTLRCMPLRQFRTSLEIMAEWRYASQALDSLEAESARRLDAIEAQSRQIARLQSVVMLDSLRIESFEQSLDLSEDRWKHERRKRWKWLGGGGVTMLAVGILAGSVFGP